MPINTQRELALEIVCKLRDAGFEALWAGGCVRDQLMGTEPKDYDVATNARPEEVQKLFGKRRTLAIGAAFGVIAVLGKDCNPVEVATFRSDGAYLDGRHPSSIVFTTAEHDAQRRDFTINGMFFDPLENRLIDYVGGQTDLEQKLVRAIGDPQARFAEDKLRMLRAVRFAATLEFQIEADTLQAIQTMAEQIGIVSAERIGAELTRLLSHSSRSTGITILARAGLMQVLFPELAAKASEAAEMWKKTLQSLDQLETANVSTALAALFATVGNPRQVSDVGRRFRFSNKDIELAVWLVEKLRLVAKAEEIPWPRLQRVLVHEDSAELMALARAVLGPDDPGVIVCQKYLALPAEQLNPPSLLTGDDLVRHGMSPGPHFGPLLAAIRDAQLEGRIQTHTEALQLAEKISRDQT